MKDLHKIASKNPPLANIIQNQGGFVTEEQIEEIVRIDRLILLLVRCNNGRFLTPAQNVKHFTNLIERDFQALEAKHGSTMNAIASGADYVRDVSLPA